MNPDLNPKTREWNEDCLVQKLDGTISPVQPCQSSEDEFLESLQSKIQGFVQRGPDRRRRMRAWYRKFAFENGIPLAVPYNPDLERFEALSTESSASSPEAADEELRSQDIALRFVSLVVRRPSSCDPDLMSRHGIRKLSYLAPHGL